MLNHTLEVSEYLPLTVYIHYLIMRSYQTLTYLWQFALTASVAAQNSTFDPREATIRSVHDALFLGRATCRAVVESYLARIEFLNPTINAITTLNPEALSIADSLDQALARGNATGPLFCVPILLKDNYDATPMNTTGDCSGLKGMIPTEDAAATTAFKEAGAVILGKSSLHELALEGLSVSSYGGQVINPYDHTRTPGGSSGGTGAAVASSFSVFGTGSDTVNSLRYVDMSLIMLIVLIVGLEIQHRPMGFSVFDQLPVSYLALESFRSPALRIPLVQ